MPAFCDIDGFLSLKVISPLLGQPKGFIGAQREAEQGKGRVGDAIHLGEHLLGSSLFHDHYLEPSFRADS